MLCVCVCVYVCYLSVQNVEHQKEENSETNAVTMTLINAWLIFDWLMSVSLMDGLEEVYVAGGRGGNQYG